MPPEPSPYDDLPVGIRRANLTNARQSLLSDRHAQELHARRLELFAGVPDPDREGPTDAEAARARLEVFDAAIAEVNAELAALPEADAAPES